MIRPKKVLDEGQTKLLEAAVRECREADEKVERGWAAILRARQAGVHDTLICKRTGWSRATLYRKFGPRP